MLRLGLVATLGCLGASALPTAGDPWDGVNLDSQPLELYPTEWVAPLRFRPPRPLFTPVPTSDNLATTRFGGDPWRVRVRVSYCVQTNGRTADVSVDVMRWRWGHWWDRRGHRRVGKAFKLAVSRWRFEPARLEGVPLRTCFETMFQVVFE